MTRKNYLFGNGESLADDASGGGGGPPSPPPYTMVEARRVIRPQVAAAAEEIRGLPPAACPADEAVVRVVMHPRYISKSSFPEKLLNAAGLRTLGTRLTEVTPRVPTQPRQQTSLFGPPTEPTTEIFVAGSRAAFARLAAFDAIWGDKGLPAADWVKVESWARPTAAGKVRQFDRTKASVVFEAVLHAGEGAVGRGVVEAFGRFVDGLGLAAEVDRRVDVAGLSYVVVEAGPAFAERIAAFEFVRAVREMPRLRMPTCSAAAGHHRPFPVKYPTEGAVDPGLRCLVLDGGMLPVAGIAQHVALHDAPGVGRPVEEFQRHGLGVTSAALFGPLPSGGELPRPYAKVEHWRVLDADTLADAQRGGHAALNRIRHVLKARPADFVCCSLGPDEPVDRDINPWTQTFDELLAPAKTLAFVAAGNNGEADRIDHLNVVQPPGDGVNLVCVGSCDSQTAGLWRKAPYSADGDRRSPSRRKPDGLAFGGVGQNPFWVIDPANPGCSLPVQGTSFAAPSVMRAVAAVKAVLGIEMTPLVLKALLTHNAEASEHVPPLSQGWGRFCLDIPRLVECAKSSYTIIYNGVLKAKKYRRLNVAVPKRLTGDVTLKATVCFATAVDPAHPCNYTRAAVEVKFRPDKGSKAAGKVNAPAAPFFGTSGGMNEWQLREQMKWETSQRATKTIDGSLLVEPVFDLHFVPREEGHDVGDAADAPYAMVVTVEAPSHPAPHSAVALRYTTLSELVPLLDIPIPV